MQDCNQNTYNNSTNDTTAAYLVSEEPVADGELQAWRHVARHDGGSGLKSGTNIIR